MKELRREALHWLCEVEPAAKAAGTRALAAAVASAVTADAAVVDISAALDPMASLPGRPARPLLVSPKAVPIRSVFTAEGRAALLHAITHIEFNAINLALDACWRFAGLPPAFYLDWLQVAGEEALHFTLLREHLNQLGADYGDFTAHDGLWTMAERTAHDVTARMALVPRTLEARGLDATPPLQAKLARAGDLRAADILGLILRDEIGHVAVGNRWYRWLCARDGVEPVAHYAVLARRHAAPRLRAPFNLDARRAAGFTRDEIDALACAAPAHPTP